VQTQSKYKASVSRLLLSMLQLESYRNTWNLYSF